VGHPLALESGGTPEGLRRLTPQALRAYHAAHYRIGPNMALVVALPPAFGLRAFLAHLEETFARLATPGVPADPVVMPAPRPAPPGSLRIGRFPADDLDQPQTVSLAWAPVADLNEDERLRLQLLLGVLAGRGSPLHRDLVDRQTRKLRTGATMVMGGLTEVEPSMATLQVGGVPVVALDPAGVGRLRAVVTQRIAWLAGLKDGPELRRMTARAQALLTAARRLALQMLNDTPGFGERDNDRAFWHRNLDRLARQPGFRKALWPEAACQRLERELATGANPFRAIAQRAGLLAVPYASAARPDRALLRRERRDRERRLRQRLGEVKARFATADAQQALARWKAEVDAATRALAERDATLARPRFLADPPLVLDDAPTVVGRVAGVPLVRVHFPAMAFTDIHLAFDLNQVPAGDRELLPLLLALVDQEGVTTGAGEALDYAATSERLMNEAGALGATFDRNTTSGRMELGWVAQATRPEEIERVVGWLESFLLRPRLEPATLPRMLDVVEQAIDGARGIYQAEGDWIEALGAGLRHQDQPVYAVMNHFASLYWLERMRWRLEGRGPAEVSGIEAALREGDRAQVGRRLAAVKGPLGAQLRFALLHAPPETWRGDLRRVLSEVRSDVAARPAELLARLRGLLAQIVVRRGARVSLTGSPANVERAALALGRLLDRLSQGAPPVPAAPPSRPVEARLRERYPAPLPLVHLGVPNEGATAATLAVSVPAPTYRAPSDQAALDLLAGDLHTGGAHSLYLRTWAAGLAYSNGLAVGPADGVMTYYADHCPDPVETMRFVAGVVKGARVDQPAVEAALASSFGDYRGTQGFAERGRELADDLTDGLTPAVVRAWKQQLLRTARAPDTVARLQERVTRVVGRALVGAGGRVAADPRAVSLVMGPERLLKAYQRFLIDSGEVTTLPLLYPRDFWPPAAADVVSAGGR
jgi:hypothetical protein